MTTGGTRLLNLTLEGPAGPLEALLHEREGVEPGFVALVCHPHPLYGGTFHNKVVHRIAGTLHALGGTVLRFNFRGIGKSAGVFDQGDGELEDARAATRYLRTLHPRARFWAAGFSFGSWITARLAAADPGVERMILVAPGVGTSSFDVLRTCQTPKLVLQGTADDICPIERLEQEFPLWSEPKTLLRIEGATHFFDKQLGALSEALSQALAGPAQGRTSSDT
jgi:uncharacterized protein